MRMRNSEADILYGLLVSSKHKGGGRFEVLRQVLLQTQIYKYLSVQTKNHVRHVEYSCFTTSEVRDIPDVTVSAPQL